MIIDKLNEILANLEGSKRKLDEIGQQEPAAQELAAKVSSAIEIAKKIKDREERRISNGPGHD